MQEATPPEKELSEVPPSPKKELPRATKLALYSVLITLLIFLIWASFYPIQQGAPAHGTVVVWGYRKVIQHPYGGTIQEILVKDGDQVRKGQPLLVLEDHEAKAQFSQVRSDYFSALIQKERLLSEKIGRTTLPVPPEVAPHLTEPEIHSLYLAQKSLLQARRAKLENDRKLILQTISGLENYLAELTRQKAHLRTHLEILERQIADLKPLTQEGYFPRNRFLELTRQAESLKSQLAEIEGNIRRTEASILEQKQRLNLLERDYLKDLDTELSEVERRISSLRDTYFALKRRLEKTTITSPIDGTVMALRFHHPGQVIRPAEPILEIVPANATFVIEAKLSPHYVEDVKVGQEVDLRFIAIDPRKTPVLLGKLVYISPDALVEQVPGGFASYYLLRIEPTNETLKELHKLGKEILPGMPVDVIVKTGKRPFLSYILKPFLDRLSTAFLR